MNKNCSILRIEKLIAGELSEKEKKETLEHIQACKECGNIYNKLETENSEFLRVYPYKEFELNYKKKKAVKKHETPRYFLFQPSFAYTFLIVVFFIGILNTYKVLNLTKKDEISFKGNEIPSVNLTPVEKENGERYAFVVGQNNGGPNVKSLQYSHKDAYEFAELLNNYGGFKKENIKLLIDTDSSQLVKNIDQFTKNIKNRLSREKALFLFYYTGHADKNGFLLKNTHFSFASLKEMINRISGNGGLAISIIDACQSGVMLAFKGSNIEKEPFFYDKIPEARGEIWIASAAENEKALESKNLKSSLFSYFLFTGLRGSADVSGDRKVTLTEAYKYAYSKTLETSAITGGILQHPLYRFNIYGEGEIVFTDLNLIKGGVTISKDCSGSFLILTDDYAVTYADFRKKVGTEVFVAIPEGEYIIINAKSDNETNIGFYRFRIYGKEDVFCGADSLKSSLYDIVESMKKK